MLKKYFLLISFFALFGCAHEPTPEGAIDPEEFQNFGQYKMARDQRTPAAQLSIAANAHAKLSDLNKIKPGRFEVYVYPKMSSQNLKTKSNEAPLLMKPQVYEVATIAMTPCQTMISGRMFAKYRPDLVFAADLGKDDKRDCAIVQVTSKTMRQRPHSLIRPNDVLAIRLYLDDEYRLHGQEKDIYVDSRNLRVDRIKNDPNLPSSSGLSLFPIDLPTEFMMIQGFPAKARLQSASDSGLDRLAVKQAQRLNHNFQTANCDAAVFKHISYYGAVTSVNWCQGLPWPAKMENARFTAVTQPIQLR